MTNKLSKLAAKTLVQRLASYESPWRPVRQAWHQTPAIHAARRADATSRWGSGGDGRRRKMAQLARDELEAHGLLAGQQLTQAGRVLARAWTWPFDRRELASALLRITERTLDGDCRRGGWVPETLIVGEAWSAGWKPFAGLQAVLMPALADGIIECNCTTPGSAFFRLAEANFDLDDMVGGAGSDAIVDELRPVYIKEYRATWRRILTDRDLYQELGECPLPVAIPLQSDRAYDDVAGIEPLLPVKESFLVVDSTSAAASLPETPTASAASATNSDTTETFTTRRDSQGND